MAPKADPWRGTCPENLRGRSCHLPVTHLLHPLPAPPSLEQPTSLDEQLGTLAKRQERRPKTQSPVHLALPLAPDVAVAVGS